MSVDLQTELKIPDFWYDYYVRFIPGAAFVAALRIIFKNTALPSVKELFLLLLAGYFCALMTQPLSSKITTWIKRLVKGIKGKDRLFVLEIQYKLGRESRDAMILSKMNAEITFFVQTSILSMIILVIQFVQKPYSCQGIFINIGVIVILIINAFGMSVSRINRAEDIKTLMDKNIILTKQST